MGQQFVDAARRVRPQLHEGGPALAPPRIGQADHGGGFNERMRARGALDRGWSDILTARDWIQADPHLQRQAALD